MTVIEVFDKCMAKVSRCLSEKFCSNDTFSIFKNYAFNYNGNDEEVGSMSRKLHIATLTHSDISMQFIFIISQVYEKMILFHSQFYGRSNEAVCRYGRRLSNEIKLCSF